MVLLLLIACFLLLAICIGVLCAISVFFRQMDALKSQFVDFVSPRSEGKTSPMAETIDLVAAQFASRLSQSIFASMQGQASGMARGLKAVEADVSQAMVAQSGNPLAMIASAMFEKQIRKNPMLGMALSNLNFGGSSKPEPSNGHSQVKFKL